MSGSSAIVQRPSSNITHLPVVNRQTSEVIDEELEIESKRLDFYEVDLSEEESRKDKKTAMTMRKKTKGKSGRQSTSQKE